MLKTLTLGNKTFPNNFIQGPLAGVSSAPFRALTWKHSQPAFTCTEMISCSTLLHQPERAQQRFVQKDPLEGPVCFQLASNNPQELAEATKRVTDFGADLIDLNCGCPVKKIRKKGAGSRLLSDPSNLYQLILAMKHNTHVPVSVKIRIPDINQPQLNIDIAQAISDAGADFLVIHGRHWTERYDSPCRYDAIRFFVDRLKIPIIGNGDIHNLQTLNAMLATGCSGIMISRASVGQPWLFKKLIAEMTQSTFTAPSMPEVGAMLIEHVTALIQLLQHETFALLQARKFAKYYAKQVPQKSDFIAEINSCHTLKHFLYICSRYFSSSI